MLKREITSETPAPELPAPGLDDAMDIVPGQTIRDCIEAHRRAFAGSNCGKEESQQTTKIIWLT
jgi:hypothetical protein